MGRPKGSKNKPKAAPPKAKAKAKRKTPARVSKPDTPPDWLRKAMAVKAPTKPKVGRKPDAIKAKFKAITAKARRGKTMANISKDKPLPDPELDPDFGAPAARFGDPKPSQLPAEEQVKIPEEQRTKGTRLTEEREPEPAPTFDEVQSGADIPEENIEALIAGTLGGSGDHHADAKRIIRRMYDDAGWTVIKALDAGIGDTRKGRKPNTSIKPDDRRDNDPKGADAGKGRGKDDPKGADDGKRS